MSKHAYLIVAHNNFDQLNTLLSLLDDKRNDIYLLIDKKSTKAFDKSTVKVSKSRLKIYSPFAIHWGGFSQCRATLLLLKEALAVENYSYLHLLSGTDLPLHSQDYIHDFFEQYKGYEFLAFVGEELYNRAQPQDRIRYYHLFRDSNLGNPFVQKLCRNIWNLVFLPLQKALKINRIAKYEHEKVGYGTNWFSITNEFASYIMANEDAINKRYKYTFCADEIFIHTLALNSKFKDRIFITEGLRDKPEDRQGSLRYINWWDGSPKIWTLADTKELMDARDRGYLFSRKFDEKVDRQIIDFIVDLIHNEKDYILNDAL